MRWVCRASKKLLFSQNFPGVVSPFHAAEGKQWALQVGMWSLIWAEQGEGCSAPPSPPSLDICSHGPYTPQNFLCMQPKQVCQMTAYLCHPCDFFQPGFKNSFWAIMCHIRINLHAGASFLSPQNNSTTVSTFQSCLIFFFFFYAKINSFCSKRTQHNQEIISLK